MCDVFINKNTGPHFFKLLYQTLLHAQLVACFDIKNLLMFFPEELSQ